MSDKRNVMDWKDSDTMKKVHLALLASSDLTTFSASKVAAYLGCTPKAVTHQLPGIRAEIEALRTAGSFAALPATTPATPGSGKKRGTPAKAQTITTDDANKAGIGATAADTGDQSDDNDGPPAKKAKTTPKSKKATASTPKAKDTDSEDADATSDVEATPSKSKAATPKKKKTVTPKSPTTSTATKKTMAKKGKAKPSADLKNDAHLESSNTDNEAQGSDDEAAQSKGSTTA